MNTKYIFLNGKFIPENEAKISILDQAYLFGFGLFETLKYQDKKIEFFDEHMQRFNAGIKILKIKSPLSKFKIKTAIHECLMKNKLNQSAIKIQLSPVQKSLSNTEIQDYNFMIMTRALHDFPKEFYSQGVKAWILNDIKIHHDELSSIKVLSYAHMQYARNFAKQKNVFETILKDSNGYIAEAASSNIFIVNQNEEIITPHLNSGILSGVVRKILIKMAKQNSFTVHQKKIREEELMNAKEVFITSSLKHVMPIYSINGKKIGEGKCGKITKKLIQLFKKSL